MNLFLISVISFAKFDEIRFTRYISALMEFLISLLGMLDVHGISCLVFFLFTRVSGIPVLNINQVFECLCGFVSIGW